MVNKKSVSIVMTAFVAILLALVIFSCAQAEPIKWETDYETAKTIAAEKNKNLFVFFSGVDWDGASVEIKETVFSSEEFLGKASKNFVLVNLDIPQTEGAMDEAQKQKNIDAANSLSVRTAPAILTVTPDGKTLSTIVYVSGTTTAKTVIEDLKEATKSANSIKANLKKLESVTGIERVKVIDALVSSVPEEYCMQFMEYFKEVPELDPENTTGLLGKYKLQLALPKSFEYINTGDLDGAAKVFTDLIDDGILDTKMIQQAYYYAAFLKSGGGMSFDEKVKEFLQKAYDTDPESDMGKEIKGMLDQLANPVTEEQVTEEK